MRKIVVPLIALAAMLAAAWHFRLGLFGSNAVTAREPSPAVARAAVLSTKTEPSNARLQLLERRIGQLEGELQTERSTRRNPAAPPTAPAEPDVPVVVDLAEAKARDATKVATLTEVFESEPRDGTWSRVTEAQLEQAFKSGDFAGSELSSIECRTTFCSLLVRHEDVAARDLMSRFARSVPGMGAEFIFRESADGAPETVAYFIRPDRDGPQHAARESYP